LTDYSQTGRFSWGSIVESTNGKVLHRPLEPAAQTGQVKCYFKSPVYPAYED